MHPVVRSSSEHDFHLQTKLLKHTGSSELAFSQGLSSFNSHIRTARIKGPHVPHLFLALFALWATAVGASFAPWVQVNTPVCAHGRCRHTKSPMWVPVPQLRTNPAPSALRRQPQFHCASHKG